MSSCVSIKKRLKKEDEYILYSQKIKGSKKTDVFLLEEFYRQKANRKILGWMPYLTAYYIGQKKYSKEAVEKEIAEENTQYEYQKEKILSDSTDIAEFKHKKENKRQKIKEKTQKRYDKLKDKYEKKLSKKNLDSTTVNELKTQKKEEINYLRSWFDHQIEKKVPHQYRPLAKLEKKHEKRLQKLETKLKKGNWLMRSVGEPPSYYDSSATTESAEQLRLYLKKKGFFNSSLEVEVDTLRKRRIKVTYRIKENKRYRINDIDYRAEDDTIHKIVMASVKKKSLLKEKDYYDEDKIAAERDRIFNLLRNNGYYEFSRQFITFEVDSTIGNKKVDISVIVKNPTRREKHKIYKLKRVDLNTNVSASKPNTDTLIYDGIHFMMHKKNLSKKILSQKIRLRPLQNYSLKKTQQTQTGVANLDYFKFINVTYQELPDDSNGTGQLAAHITTSPFDKYQLSDEWGVNVTTQAQGIPGPFFNLAFKSRNFLGGFRTFQFNVRGSIESVSASDAQGTLSNKELGGTGAIHVPQFLFPEFIFSDRFEEKIDNANTETIFSSGLNLVSRPEYDRITFNGNMTYSFKPKVTSRLNIYLFDANWVNTSRISNSFLNYLETLANNGNNLKESFDQSLISSIGVNYTTNNNELGKNKNSRFIRLSLKSGGLGTWAIDELDDKNGKFLGTNYFQFLKGAADFRLYKPVTRTATVAFRLNVGAAYPYALSDAIANPVLPYEEYFFIGGSNSIRAWKPRRLGPGSYTPPTRADGSFDYSFEQPGEFMIESSAEFRFNLISFLDMAYFIDAGNIWTFNEDPTRPGANIDEDVFKEIAVGTGLGFRFDFTFLILRVDLGIKLWNPARPLGERFVLDNLTFRKVSGDKEGVTINLGIGYPF